MNMEFKEKNINKETMGMSYEQSVDWIMQEAHETNKGMGLASPLL